ncbi:MAG: hypothetical protein QOE23_2393 [Pseudonocardiales bacterium]|nr:hypothetical protein [Pseudonocardiales bacterium]
MNKLLTVGCAAATFAVLLTGAASDATANAPCGTTAPDIDGSSYVSATSSAANIRTGSSTSCTSIGSLLAGQRIDYYCYTRTSTYTWSYLRDVATGKVGWVRDDLLPGGGSLVYCGF